MLLVSAWVPWFLSPLICMAGCVPTSMSACSVCVCVPSCAHWKRAQPGDTARQQPLLCWAAGCSSPQPRGIPGSRHRRGAAAPSDCAGVCAEGEEGAATWGCAGSDGLRTSKRSSAATERMHRYAYDGIRDCCDGGVQKRDKSGQLELQNKTDVH